MIRYIMRIQRLALRAPGSQDLEQANLLGWDVRVLLVLQVAAANSE